MIRKKRLRAANKNKKQESLGEIALSMTAAVVIALIFRSFMFEPFHIPSGSMKSTLMVGDYIFVSKYSYGYSRYSLPFGIPLIKGRIFSDKPERGDVIVFKFPQDNSTNYIKRLIGLPGDTIQVLNSVLYINNKEVPRIRVEDYEDNDQETGNNVVRIPQYIETLPNGVSYHVLDQRQDGNLDNTEPYKVPEGYYFFMGDNRDNSTDSRVLESVGYVPEVNLVGRANRIFFSTSASLWKPWQWISGFRSERIAKSVTLKTHE